MTGRGALTNAEWERLEPLLPRGGSRGGRWSDHRKVIDGVLFRVRTGIQWRDLPERFGPWETVYKRHRRWSADGTWERLLVRVQAEQDACDGIDWDVSVDSTTARAHQHAAGAGVAESVRPAGGGGQAGECSGRSRGGFSTKIHLSAEGRCRPMSALLTPGQY
ncbi:IS5 family transposase, partial [Streptomyces sp. NPDC088400]|uniref:IS5 family transposase n=1 Tax=Streptomyces sp. NPDC088400 TaxID=3365861 RepID=UPI00382FF19E